MKYNGWQELVRLGHPVVYLYLCGTGSLRRHNPLLGTETEPIVPSGYFPLAIHEICCQSIL